MIVAGTGHRPDKLGGYAPSAAEALIRKASDWLLPNRGKIDRIISGMALGWDQALAVATLRANIPLVCAVPFKGQESQWPMDSQKRYREILERAKEIVYVCDPGYEKWKMQKRNEWMVDNSDVVLAMWDGSSGGTANCVAYAHKTRRRIEHLWEWDL